MKKNIAKPVIGLVGQICAGKSAVAQAFRRQGARVFDADKVVHEIYIRSETIEQVRKIFGAGVLNSTGGIDRKALGNVVFSNAASLKRLTSEVVFPRTAQAMLREIQDFQASEAPALVLDAPTLFEAGRENLCQHIVFVAAPLLRRQEWARARGWKEGEIERRETNLEDEKAKRLKSDVIIGNSGTLEDVDQTVAKLLKSWAG